MAANDPLFDGVPPHTPFYFVHSYAPAPEDASLVIGAAEYEGASFAAAVRSGNLVGVQFHPERSGTWGVHVLGNFVRSVEAGAHAA